MNNSKEQYFVFSLLFSTFLRFVKESSRWLITKGRIDEAIVILEDIAKTNGKVVEKDKMEKFKVIFGIFFCLETCKLDN